MDTIRRDEASRGGVSPGDRITSESIAGVLRVAALPGEHATIFAQSDQLIGKSDFQKVAVVVTEGRLLIVSPAPGAGFVLSMAETRDNCRVVNRRDTLDGSELMVVATTSGYTCLYFEAAWRPEAGAILEALDPLGPARLETRSVDRFQLSQEFAGLWQEIEEEEEEDF